MLIFLDGADHNDTKFKYTIVNSMAFASPGRYGLGGYFSNTNANFFRAIAAGDTDDTLIVGFAFKGLDSPITVNPIVSFKSDGNATEHVSFYFQDTGSGVAKIQAYRGSSGGTLLGTSTEFANVTDEWHYYEFKVKLHDSTGTVEVRRDGVSILALTGQDTKNGGTEAVFSSIHWGRQDATGIDDIYICNNDGATNNDFLGELVIETLHPDGNGTDSDLLGSDGNSTNNYQLVDEVGTDDADYVGSAVNGDKDTYTLANLIRTDGDIVGIATNHRLVKSDAGAISARRVLITDNAVPTPTEDVGADIALATPYGWTTEILEENPVLAVPWDQAAINDLEVGIEVRP